MSRQEDRFRELCAGNVLGTLSEDERRELDELLKRASPEMLRVYDELEWTALHLPAGTDLVEPPPEVRRRILEAVRAEKHIVDVVDPTDGENTETEPSHGQRENSREDPGTRVVWWLGLTRPRVALTAVGALTAVVVGLGLYAASFSRSATEEERRGFNLAEDSQQKERLLQPAQTDAMPPFEKIKGLVGEWEGKFEWSGARSGGGPMNATYYLTGNGSAIVEDLFRGSDVIMTSVYHMDGDALRMTHFCAAGNQPRLRATSADGDAVSFELVDITNLEAPEAGHVHKSELYFRDENHIEVRFTFLGDGKESYDLIELERVPAESS